jgi:AraC family transcriptional regulator
MKIVAVDRKPVRVACLRYTGPGGESIGRFWRGTVAPWLADHGLVDCPRYGVVVDDPMKTAPESCRYDACVELPPGLSVPDAAETWIPGGRYAVTPFKGHGMEIGPAWNEFLQACHRDPSFARDESRPPHEHYPRGATHDARTGVFVCELCLPARS